MIPCTTYSCRTTAYSCARIGNTGHPWSVGFSTNTWPSDAVTSSDGPHPTPLSSTTKPVEDITSTTTEPHSTVTTEETITEQTRIMEDFITTEPVMQTSTRVEGTTFESPVDDGNGAVSGSQSGVIAGTVTAVFLVIFLVVFSSIFVAVIMSKKRKKDCPPVHINQRFQDISNGI